MECRASRMFLIACAFAAALVAAIPATASGASPAAAYPAAPVTVIVPYPPGGPIDIVARFIADKLGANLGQPFVVANRSGAGGNIGVGAAMRAKPDGYTITLITTTSSAINPALFRELPYDPDDVLPISLIAMNDYVLVANPRLPARTLEELFRLIRSRPGKMNGAYASATSQVGNGMLRKQYGLVFADIPYQGDVEALNAVIAGDVDFYFSSSPRVAGLAAEGRLRVLASATGQRSELFHDLPTFAEAGAPDFVDMSAWIGVATVKGTPVAVVDKLNGEIRRILQDPAAQNQLKTMGFRPVSATLEEARNRLVKDRALWKDLVDKTGVAI